MRLPLVAAVLAIAGLIAVARGNLIQLPISGGAAPVAAVWDAAQKGSGITLSGTGPNIASSNSASWATVRSTTSKAVGTGKVYWEMGCDVVNGGTGWMGGVQNASGSLTSYAGSTANGAGFQASSTTTESLWWSNSASTSVSGTWCSTGTANRTHYTFDINSSLIWAQVYAAGTGSGKWNSVTVTSPAAPTTGGYPVAFAGPYFIAWSGINTGPASSSTLYAATAAVEGPVPTGYTVWDAAVSGGAGGGGSVWSLTDKASAVTIGTSVVVNDKATQSTTANTFSMVRGTQSYAVPSVNKKVFVLTITAADSTGGWIGGVADGSVALSYPGAASHGFGVQVGGASMGDYQDANGGNFGGGTATCAGGGAANFHTGDTLVLAIDFNTGKLWCSKDCTTWVGGGDPGAGTGQKATLTNATYFPAWSGGFFGAADVAVLNTNPALGTCSNLGGFTGWG